MMISVTVTSPDLCCVGFNISQNFSFICHQIQMMSKDTREELHFHFIFSVDTGAK